MWKWEAWETLRRGKTLENSEKREERWWGLETAAGATFGRHLSGKPEEVGFTEGIRKQWALPSLALEGGVKYLKG